MVVIVLPLAPQFDWKKLIFDLCKESSSLASDFLLRGRRGLTDATKKQINCIVTGFDRELESFDNIRTIDGFVALLAQSGVIELVSKRDIEDSKYLKIVEACIDEGFAEDPMSIYDFMSAAELFCRDAIGRYSRLARQNLLSLNQSKGKEALTWYNCIDNALNAKNRQLSRTISLVKMAGKLEYLIKRDEELEELR